MSLLYLKRAFLCIALMILLGSCHSPYVHLNYDLHHGAVMNEEGNRIACLISTAAYRPARGIARFPDGGVPEYLHQKVAIYVLDTEAGKLWEAVDLSDLCDLIGYSRSNWKSRLAFHDSMILSQVSPVMGWDWYLEHGARNRADSLEVKQLREKYAKPFRYDLVYREVSPVSQGRFDSLYTKEDKVDFMELQHQLDALPVEDLGLVIREIYPKKDAEYIQETIYFKNPSRISRRAVVEQIIAKLDPDEIRDILVKMEDYRQEQGFSPGSLEEDRYDHLYDMIRDLL